MQSSVEQLASALERLTAVLRHYVQDDELSLSAAAVLATLTRVGPCRLTRLAGIERVTQPAMTQIVTRLESLGLARRTADPDDGRAVLVEITDAGRERLTARRAARAARLSDALDLIGPADRDALVAAVPALQALVDLAGHPAVDATPA